MSEAPALDYAHREVPFAHQLRVFNETRELKRYALFWEQGTGKTKVTIDTACWLHARGKINALLVVAPNGVHSAWVVDELPKHVPHAVEYHADYWDSKRARTQKHELAMRRLFERGENGGRLNVLCMSYDGLRTDLGGKFARKFLEYHRCMYVVDESSRIKSPGSKRAVRVHSSGRYAEYRRILNGTPMSNSPLDVYAQIKFLDAEAWAHLGISDFAAFKAYFAEWRTMARRDKQTYEEVVSYKNLHVLRAELAKWSSRVLKEEVLDLPAKLYTKRYFDLAPRVRAMYEQLREEYITQLESGEEVTAMMAVVRLIRFQQITSGYLPGDESRELQPVDDVNPRLELLEECVEDTPHKHLVLAKYHRDVDMIMDLYARLGRKAVRYDGTVTREADRIEAKRAFQEGDAEAFVGNPAAMGVGHTLHAARTVIFYNTTYKYDDRVQAEDRAHRIGQHHPVLYVDLVARQTVDVAIIEALRKKLNLSAEITGDKLKQWI